MRKKHETAPYPVHAGRVRPGEKALRTIIVSHPVYGTFRAAGVRDKLGAVQAAAKAWKLQWSKIAKECTFTDVVDTA